MLLAAFVLATLIPLNDLGPAPYAYGYYGGLWEEGSNTIPADHAIAGLRRAALIQPLDADGNPSPDGKIGFLAVGGGEAARIANAFSSTTRMRAEVVFVNAAAPGLDASHWTRDIRATLPPGLTDQQIQVAWVELQDDYPYSPLPIQDSDAYRLKSLLSESLRAMKKRWPNLQVAYLSSPVFGGYATTQRNPEPYPYEAGLTVRWTIVGQITLMRTGYLWDSRIGDVNYERGSAPWITWGPYLWADGTTPRSDGLTWTRDDFEPDGETLSEAGALKGAALLRSFLMSEPTASWLRVYERVRPIRAR